VSNFVSTPGTGTAAPARTSVPTSALRASVGEPSARTAIAPFPWRIEKDAASSAILRTAATSVELEYTLAGGGRNSQFVALASDLNAETFSALGFRLQTDRPARIWVQVRSGDGRRWGRTAYVDPAGSDLLLPLATVRPMGQAAAGIPASREVTSILLVIDLTNAFPGRQGRLTVLSSELVK
jgi:hypothetical protein